jgi:hypothetical protein
METPDVGECLVELFITRAGVSPHYFHLSKRKLPPSQSVWGFFKRHFFQVSDDIRDNPRPKKFRVSLYADAIKERAGACDTGVLVGRRSGLANDRYSFSGS